MPLLVPDDAPHYRFMRYVRPQGDDPTPSKHGSLFPLRPATRKLRVGVDVQTLTEPQQELLSVLGRDEEVEPILLVQNSEAEPRAWMDILGCRRWYMFSFTTVDEAPRFADASTVGISGFEDGECKHATRGHFFSLYAQLDHAARATFSDDSGLTLSDRHRAAALACAAEALDVDVIVTNAPTAGREDIADNDKVASVTPQKLLPLFGHFLRMTGNRVMEVSAGHLLGGAGTYVRKSNARSIADLYLGGIDATVPHLTAIRLMATAGGDAKLARSAAAITLRLSRAARAVDELLAALSNSGKSAAENTDIQEATAESFDRILLYLCAALDRYARVTRALLDTSLDADKQRGSLTSTNELRALLKHFEPADSTDLIASGNFAWVMAQLRNRIHALPLESGRRLSRSYGSSAAVALTLDGLVELDPITTSLTQEQLDRLGVWMAASESPFGTRTYVADIATIGTTLFSEMLRYVDTFSKFILRTEVEDKSSPTHRVLGCWANEFGELPGAEGSELLYRTMFGWSDFAR